MLKENYQVIIAGAGPAGLAASLTLTANKISHCIFEAHKSAKPKPGDALPPNAKPLLKQLGILDLLKNDLHIPYYGSKSIWGNDTIHQEEFIANIYGHGYLLDRLLFEQQLIEQVKHNNTPFYQGYKIKQVKENNGMEVLIQGNVDNIQLQAPYVIDATGRKASIARHLGVQKIDMDKQLTFSFWHQLEQSIPRQIWIEATQNGWWYLSPSQGKKVNCMFFTLKELTPHNNDTTSFLYHELDQTQQIKSIIKPNSQELLNYKIMPSGTSYLEKPYGDKWLAIGDAAFSFDPISSYGISSALATGYYGANAISSALSDEQDAFISYHYVLANGAQSYIKKLAHQYSLENRWSDSFYWKNRLR